MLDNSFPQKIKICEVSPRDGFQSEAVWIPTETKVKIIRELVKTGIESVELTSFVHPLAIPQLKDAEKVVEQTRDLTNVKFRALVPNIKGAERAVKVGVNKLKLMLSATDSHSLANANRKVEDAQNELEPIVNFARKNNVEVSGSISVVFGCPYEGLVPMENILKIMNRYKEMGIQEISLADTSGMANPKQVDSYLEILRDEFSTMIFSMHLHNTRGMAFANAVAALRHNVINFDSSISGLGGCPYNPGATGNIATEDLVHGFEEMGINTGISLERLISVSREVVDILNKKTLDSYMLKAGPTSRLFEKPTGQIKVQN